MHLKLVTALTVAALTIPIAAALAQSPGPGIAQAALADEAGVDVGSVTWTQGPGSVTVEVTVRGLPPGFHGFHVHTIGECVPPFTSAGPHLNRAGGSHPEHAADQPVLLVNADGTGSATFVTDRYATGDIVGAAAIVHADPDNYANIPLRYAAPGPSPSAATSAEPAMVPGPDSATLATGDAGPRIACGVIEALATAP